MRWDYPLSLPDGIGPELDRLPAGIRPYSEFYLSELVRVRGMRHGVEPNEVIEYGVVQMNDAGIPDRRIKPAREALESTGIITVDGSYLRRVDDPAGVGKCFGHKIRDDLAGRPVVVGRGDHPEIARRIEDMFPERVAKRREYQNLANGKDSMLARVWDDVCGYTFDGLPAEYQDHPTVTNHMRDDVRYVVRDTTSFRVHTSVGQIKKVIRQHLVHDRVAEPLALVDISSSQMMLAALWSVRGMTSPCPDTLRFVRDCTERDVYRLLADETNASEPEPGVTWTARDEDPKGTTPRRMSAKVESLACLYDTVHRMRERSPVGRSMLRLYPLLFRRMAELRIAEFARSHEFAITIQSIESRIMIDGVLAQLHREFPEVPWIPMHDGIMCPESLTTHVNRVILHHWRRVLTAVGVHHIHLPTVSSKTLAQTHLSPRTGTQTPTGRGTPGGDTEGREGTGVPHTPDVPQYRDRC